MPRTRPTPPSASPSSPRRTTDLPGAPDALEPEAAAASDSDTEPAVGAEPAIDPAKAPTEPDSPDEEPAEVEPGESAVEAAPEPGSVSAQLFSHADAPAMSEPEEREPEDG